MRRQKAIILGIGFLLISVGYVAWCWRPFYLRPTLIYDDNVPPAAKVAVEKLHKDQNLWGPSPFNLKYAIHLLGKPWKNTMEYRVLCKPEWNLVNVKMMASPYVSTTLIKEDGEWQMPKKRTRDDFWMYIFNRG